MKTQNNFKKELEKKQKGLFLIGLLASLSLTLMAFEWATFDVDYLAENIKLKDEVIEIEVPKEIQIEKPKPKVKAKEFNPEEDEKLRIIDDKKEVVETKVENPIIDSNLVSEEIQEQEEIGEKEPEIEVIEDFVDKKPSFPGGEQKLYEFLSKNITYPQMAKQANIQGKVFIQFVVEKDGSITNVKVMRGIGSGCDKEAERVIKKMPKWSPGWKDGLTVRTRFNIPVFYKLK